MKIDNSNDIIVSSINRLPFAIKINIVSHMFSWNTCLPLLNDVTKYYINHKIWKTKDFLWILHSVRVLNWDVKHCYCMLAAIFNNSTAMYWWQLSQDRCILILFCNILIKNDSLVFAAITSHLIFVCQTISDCHRKPSIIHKTVDIVATPKRHCKTL